MALEMRDRVSELTSGWRRRGFDLDFGVGIATGYATCGQIGFEGRLDYAAIGTVTNLAKRLCSDAASGQILISQRVAIAIEDVIEVEPIGELSLKGFQRPMAAYSVRGLRPPN